MFMDTEMVNIKTKDKIIKLKKWFSSSQAHWLLFQRPWV